MNLMTFRIYGFEACPWCLKAKELAAARNVPFEYVSLEPREVRVAWMDDRDFTGKDRTLPKIFIVGEDGVESFLIGGYNDLVTYLEGEA